MLTHTSSLSTPLPPSPPPLSLTTHTHTFRCRADLFSIGAISLELLSPHQFFSHEWVSAYRVARTGTKQARQEALTARLPVAIEKVL